MLPSAKENVQPYKVAKAKNDGHFSVKLEFQGHYEEPCVNLKISFDLLEDMEEMIYAMTYSPTTGKWESVMIHDANDECMGPSEYTEEAAPAREPAGQAQQNVKFGAKTTAQRTPSVNKTSGVAKQPVNRGRSQNKTNGLNGNMVNAFNQVKDLRDNYVNKNV